MTREEEIRQAALKYSFDTDGGVTGDLNTGRDDFMEGALWGDAHPKSTWHSVADGDLPKEPKGNAKDLPFIVTTKDGYKFLAYFDCYEWKEQEIPSFFNAWDCEISANYWMEIPQLKNESEVKV